MSQLVDSTNLDWFDDMASIQQSNECIIHNVILTQTTQHNVYM